MLIFLGKISGFIVAGGIGNSVVDFLTGDLEIKQLPYLPQGIDGSSMVSHFGTILLCGGFGNEKNCLKFENGTWKKHSTFDKERVWHSAVTTQKATFFFGGERSRTTYEYLLKDSSKWLTGKTKIPGCFEGGYAIAVKSEQKIWLIGGWRTEKRILSFDVESHTFQVVPFQLNVGRFSHRCGFIPNTKKIMITGGCNDGYLDSTEVLDTEDGSIIMASPMNSKRFAHGMGVVTVNGEDRVAVFGGLDDGGDELDCAELYNTQTEKWEMTDFKLSEAKYGFSFLSIKLGHILS